MEVASPIAFTHNTAGSKRALCSAGFMESDGYGYRAAAAAMDVADDNTQQHMFKRRRFATDSVMDNLSDKTSAFPAFRTSLFNHNGKTVLSPSNGQQPSMKRCRIDALSKPAQIMSNNSELLRNLESQASEIQNLKAAESTLETTVTSLRNDNEKVNNENKILKRAVVIQQERQQHAAKELQQAHQDKLSAADQIKRLEQMILSLRYHMQVQHSSAGNNFMGFPPQPPNVF